MPKGKITVQISTIDILVCSHPGFLVGSRRVMGLEVWPIFVGGLI